jgi:RNA polymerase sigma factor (sigma-70 family)
MEKDPRDIVERCRRGDARAWDEFVDRYQRLVWSVARSCRLPAEDCDDVTQTVLLSALRHLEELRDPERVTSWLLTSAHRESWRVARARSRPVDLVGDFASLAEPSPERAADLESMHAVREALERLGEPCRSLLTALFREDSPSYPRISAELGMPVGSIGPTRARCLGKLRELLAKAGFGTDPEASPESPGPGRI